MPLSVVMPALEMAQETGKLVAWRKKEGEPVLKGETLLEVETDKAVMEIEAPGDGVLAGVKVREGAVVPVGQTIAWIVRPGETPPQEETARTSARKTTPDAAGDPCRRRRRRAAGRLIESLYPTSLIWPENFAQSAAARSGARCRPVAHLGLGS